MRSSESADTESQKLAPDDPSEAPLARRLGLRRIPTEALSIRRLRCGRGFSYLASDGNPIRDPKVRRRLVSLAVPPAYEEVLYAEDPAAHLQAVGRDAAGRLQYRYHPKWEQIREKRKAARLLRLLEALPRIRRGVNRHLASGELSREFALSAAIELVAISAIRPGNEEYTRAHGTRGATTLLKSHVVVAGNEITLSFRSKGGKRLEKTFRSPRLAPAIARLRALPGARLLQYRDEAEQVRPISSRETNAFLRVLAGVQISLKDLRTLCASALVVDRLARAVPAPSERQRKRQVLQAIRQAADDLDNTPAICRRSYVHAAVVTAFEDGALERLSSSLNGSRGSPRREKLLAQVIADFAH